MGWFGFGSKEHKAPPNNSNENKLNVNDIDDIDGFCNNTANDLFTADTYDEFKQDHYKFIDKVVKICPKNGNLLFLAAATFKPDGVRDLIFEHGVDPNEKSTGGILPITKVLAKIYTSLIKKGMPLTRVQYETLKMLLDGGASPHIRDKEYKNAFDYVKRINNNKITKLVEKYRQQANNNFDANNNKNNTSQNNTTQTTNNGQTTNQGGGTRRKHRGRKAKKSRRHRHR